MVTGSPSGTATLAERDPGRAQLARDRRLLRQWREQLRDELVVDPSDPCLLMEEEMVQTALERLDERAYTDASARRNSA